MEALLLTYRAEPLREFALADQALEIGSGAGADVVVHDPDVAERHLLVRRDGLEVLVHDLKEGADRAPRRLVAGVAYPLGRHHALMRLTDVPTTRREASLSRTEPVVLAVEPDGPLTLVVGLGTDARRVVVSGRPIVIGSGAFSDLVLVDRAVSARHCRVEPSPEGPRVRDLASRNGTFVDGVRTGLAALRPGSRIRVGRTDVHVVSRSDAPGRSGMVVASQPMRELMERVERIAALPWPVLVLGETGVGKEGIAEAIHAAGPRRAGPFVAVNAGAMPRELIESELFGHERGAFTGALAVRRGVFEQASGGTLFLDELGELPLELQPRLLRVLETGEVRRVGGETTIRTDVRLVCATHRELRKRVAAGLFREDLYYRISTAVLAVPPLRQRPGDVRALAAHFVALAEAAVGPRRITQGAVERLLGYGWPGNVRELRNVIWSAAERAGGGVIDVAEIDAALGDACAVTPEGVPGVATLLERHHGNVSAAARSMGISRSTLRNRLRREKT